MFTASYPLDECASRLEALSESEHDKTIIYPAFPTSRTSYRTEVRRISSSEGEVVYLLQRVIRNYPNASLFVTAQADLSLTSQDDKILVDYRVYGWNLAQRVYLGFGLCAAFAMLLVFLFTTGNIVEVLCPIAFLGVWVILLVISLKNKAESQTAELTNQIHSTLGGVGNASG